MLIVYGYRVLRGKESPAYLAERCGSYDRTISLDGRRPRFWVHAVSVGEVMAAAPVLKELRARHPDAFIVLSVTTMGGREVAQSKMPPADHVLFFPLDFLPAVQNAVRTIRPDVLILMEWEIWPNLLSAAKRYGATVAVVNGRISDNGLKRGVRVRWFLAAALRCVDVLAMQSAEDARRAVLVGANPDTVYTVGNTKFDESAMMLSPAERTELRRDFGIPDGNDVFICGSTRDAPDTNDPDEEDLILKAVLHLYLVHAHNDLSVIIAPRHLERADAIAKRLAADGKFTVRRRSQPALVRGTPDTRYGDIWLLDTFGELGRAYAVADVAFVGGSLVKRGGQSVFQPLAQGVPAVFGPHMNNQRDISALAQAEGVGFLVRDAVELAETVHRLLTLPPDEKAALAAKSRALIERNAGVTARALDLVEAARTGRSS